MEPKGLECNVQRTGLHYTALQRTMRYYNLLDCNILQYILTYCNLLLLCLNRLDDRVWRFSASGFSSFGALPSLDGPLQGGPGIM